MITSMDIKNFKCFKDFHIDLGPFNVLVGPNDTGKTAFLQAITLLAAVPPKQNISMSDLRDRTGVPVDRAAYWLEDLISRIRIAASAVSPGGAGHTFALDTKRADLFGSDVVDEANTTPSAGNWKEMAFEECIGKAAYYMLSAKALREVSGLASKMTVTGQGFPAFLDNINREDSERFAQIQRSFSDRFTFYLGPKIKVVDKARGDKGLVVEFPTKHAGTLPAEAVSDGVMLSLAFIGIALQPDPPQILLVEEPENGVHHASLKHIVDMLQDLSSNRNVQVILTTHSPDLVDCVEPEVVQVFAKDEEGAVHARRLSEHPEVEKLKKIFMTGEIWTGFDEKKLVAGQAKFDE